MRNFYNCSQGLILLWKSFASEKKQKTKNKIQKQKPQKVRNARLEAVQGLPTLKCQG